MSVYVFLSISIRDTNADQPSFTFMYGFKKPRLIKPKQALSISFGRLNSVSSFRPFY